mgnify:CR=1 FL=1
MPTNVRKHFRCDQKVTRTILVHSKFNMIPCEFEIVSLIYNSNSVFLRILGTTRTTITKLDQKITNMMFTNW